MRRYIAAWEGVIQAHLLTSEWTMFVDRLHISPEEQELFRGLLRAMIKPQSSMPLEVVDDLTRWALNEIDAVRSMAKHLERVRFFELHALANGMARALAHKTDWVAAAESQAAEASDGNPEERPTLVVPRPESQSTVPVPGGADPALLARCRPPKPAPLPVFPDHEVPTVRGAEVDKATAQAAATADDAEISYSQEFVDLDLDDEPDD